MQPGDVPVPPEPTDSSGSPALDGAASAAESGEGTVDLDAIRRDLDAVEQALPRLDDGSYWVDEATGDEIPDEVLAANPLARRA